MKKILVILVLIAVVNCRGKFNNSDVLKQLDQVLSDNPEMVLDSLNTFDPLSFNHANRAYYYVLKAAAIDKCNKPIPEDSTLYFSQEYYKEKEDLYFLARTQYYIGKTVFLKKPINAFEIYKEAEINLKESSKKDYHLLGLIYYGLGTIQSYNLNSEYLKDNFNKSAEAFFMAGDTINAIYSLRSLAHNLVQLKKYKEAKEVLDSTATLIEQIDDGIRKEKFAIQRAVLHNVYCVYYTMQRDFEEALKHSKLCIYYYESHDLKVNPQYYYTTINCLLYLKKYEEVEVYKDKILSSLEEEEDEKQQMMIYRILIHLAKMENNYKNVSELQEKYMNAKENFDYKHNFYSVEELEAKFEKAEQQKRELQNRNRYLITILICCLTITFTLGITFYSNFLFRKQKRKNKILIEELKRTRWGYALFKEIIESNYQCFEVVDNFMMKNIQGIEDKVYSKFQELMRNHKSEYINQIYTAFYNTDASFIDTVKKINKSITKDDLIIATLIKHGGESRDITGVLRISMDALKKRKQRLKIKVMGDNNKEVKLEMFFKEL